LARYSKPAKDLNLLPRPFRRVVHSDDQVTGSFSGGAEAVWLDAREVDNFQDSINWSEQPDHNAVVRFATQVAKVAGLSGPQLTLAA